jgi:hypothetical protein
MNLINTIENAYNCLDSLKKDKNKEKSQIKNANIYSNRNELIITSLKELTTKINAIDQIYEITISENNFKNLKIFENKKFPQLKILKLENNNIRDIGSLMKAKFNALYLLNLEKNKIDNTIIENLKSSKNVFPNLCSLSLYCNYITDYEIFNIINKNLVNLKVLFIGANAFDENTINVIKEQLNFPNIKKLGLTDGVVSQNTIDKFFSHLEIENIKELIV